MAVTVAQRKKELAKKAPKAAPGLVKAKSHKSFQAMVLEAVKTLGERNGSSLQAIKKYIAANHNVDLEKQGHFIRAGIVKAVGLGVLSRTKGTGANGSFKLGTKKVSKPKAAVPEKTSADKEKKSEAPAKEKKPAKKTTTAAKKTKTATKAKVTKAKAPAAKKAVKAKAE